MSLKKISFHKNKMAQNGGCLVLLDFTYQNRSIATEIPNREICTITFKSSIINNKCMSLKKISFHKNKMADKMADALFRSILMYKNVILRLTNFIWAVKSGYYLIITCANSFCVC